MSQSDYIHKIEHLLNRDVIVIEDLDLGRMSVTNNIELVIAEIEIMEHVDATRHLVVYKDSDGLYDGSDYLQERFVSLQEDNWKAAIAKYIKILIARQIPVAVAEYDPEVKSIIVK